MNKITSNDRSYESNDRSYELKLAFRKPVKGLVDWFLKRRIGKFIHVELIFPEPFIYERNSFSSRGIVKHLKNTKKGVYFSHLEYDDSWEFLNIEVTQTEILKIRKKCMNIIGAKYDIIGAIFWAGYNIPVEEKTAWWCSEAVAYVLGINEYRKTPVELYNCIKLNDVI